ncbi:MAG: glycosyltransferase family 2 protein [Clostridia bacterium]|nr:glycosyltransferase family 2 protein [Clostridia bacterium]
MNKNESIDVVVPAYKVGEYIEECLSSLLRQTYQDFKLFVIYDECNDNTLEIIESFKQKFKTDQFNIIFSPKKDGLGAARDIALDSGLLKGKYVIFPDSDDYVEPNYLERLFKKAEETNADITYCGFDRVDAKTRKVISVDMIHNGNKTIMDLLHYNQIIYLNISVWNKLYKIDLFSNVRFTNIKRGEDLFCFLKILPYVKCISFVNNVLYHYRIRSDSLSNDFGLEQLNEMCKGFLVTKDFYKKNYDITHDYFIILTAIAFLRIGISATYRASHKDKANKKRCYRISRSFLDDYFPEWYKNPYISFRTCSKYGFKSMMVWHTKLLFKHHMFGLFIFFYENFVKLTHKDIKW